MHNPTHRPQIFPDRDIRMHTPLNSAIIPFNRALQDQLLSKEPAQLRPLQKTQHVHMTQPVVENTKKKKNQTFPPMTKAAKGNSGPSSLTLTKRKRDYRTRKRCSQRVNLAKTDEVIYSLVILRRDGISPSWWWKPEPFRLESWRMLTTAIEKKKIVPTDLSKKHGCY